MRLFLSKNFEILFASFFLFILPLPLFLFMLQLSNHKCSCYVSLKRLTNLNDSIIDFYQQLTFTTDFYVQIRYIYIPIEQIHIIKIAGNAFYTTNLYMFYQDFLDTKDKLS